ncbi:MAG TPA: hypothetical protein VHE35_21640 [Kofleriaceae bacterium]|nr:hypothetical protein [Kofleriaceae bacterium]
MRAAAVALAVVVALLACNHARPRPAAVLSNRASSGARTTFAVPRGPVTARALTAFFRRRFPAAVADGTLTIESDDGSIADEVIEELRIVGIRDMSEVPSLVPDDFERRGLGAIKASPTPSENLTGLLRDLMIIRDARGYFGKAWRHAWAATGAGDFPAPLAYGLDLGILREYGVFTPDTP